MTKKQVFTCKTDEETPYLELLADKSKLSKAQIKKLFTAGAVWINSGKADRRVRKIKGTLKPGEKIKLYYDPNIAPFDMSQVKCVHDTHNWGIWYKPAGLLSQGTKYGDEFTILRHIEKQINRAPFLVHRLDKETSGLMIIAYNKKSARFFSEEIKDHRIKKFYQALVKGIVEQDEGSITSKIDNKNSETKFKTFERRNNTTFVEAELITGRKHQVRIHLDSIGHPILGDNRYGEENSHKDGLQLIASKIIFNEPSRKKEMTIELDKNLRLF
jgi:tRNA pseudouridine32 synthase/23S rRNA pseudouridine746 synthase